MGFEKLSTLSVKIGNTQGMRFKIKPPSKAPPIAAQKLRVRSEEENDEEEAREEGADEEAPVAA